MAKMLGVVGILYLVTQLTTRAVLAGLGYLVEQSDRANYAPFVRMLMILNSGVNLFVYLV